MSFVDYIVLKVKAGDGGDGHLSFHHEKFVDKGGPDGGDGGDGGDVIIRASNNQDTLAKFRYHKEILAGDGLPGQKNNRHGKTADNKIIDVPVGTAVYLEDRLIVDLITNEQEYVIAKGGKGGFGNAHFVSSKRQTPRFAEKGLPGEKFVYRFELKSIADVGLIGLPNAGKSTLLSKISHAKPEIADYPFTTLKPNLGVVDYKGRSILFADIPGLIEGAAEGRGLGHDFLRHIERTRLIIHMIDVNSDDVIRDYQLINQELKKYSRALFKKKQIVVFSKIDSLTPENVSIKIDYLRSTLPKTIKLITISSFSRQGVDQLLELIRLELEKIIKPAKEIPVVKLTADLKDSWQVQKVKKGFLISGWEIEKFAFKTDFNNDESVMRLKNILKRKGIIKELIKNGIKPEDKIMFNRLDDFLVY